jgi:hypothetical protein
MDNYKKNDPRMWMFHNKYAKTVIIILVIVIVCMGIYEKYFQS